LVRGTIKNRPADRPNPPEKPPEPKPAEPFEECGPGGGYSGAGVDDEAKDD
jgi:hypothetical protein